MPISSVIINASAGTAENVSAAVNELQGATVMEIRENSIIAILDTQDPKQDKNLWDQIKNTPNAINLDLIYHNFEDVEGSKP